MATQTKRLKMEQEGATVQSLSWDHPVQLVGEKVDDPDLLNCCMRCCLPILIYGRMIPCKHVLCLDCAKKHSSSICSKCGDKVTRIEQSALGTVYVCSYGSSRHGPGGCKRTYLSYRDMEAHIKHRHKKKEATAGAVQPMPATGNQIMSLSQPMPNLNQPPPHPFMRPPTLMPPHMVNHPPPVIVPTSNVPPPGGLTVRPQQGHVQTIQSNAMNMRGNISTIPAIQNIPMQPAPQNTLPPRHPLPANPLPNHHNMMGSGPPPAQHMQPHQQMSGAPPHAHRHVHPQQSLNPPASNSKSHGNLISIPIQGSQNWSGQGQQQWSNQVQPTQQQHHRPSQYNN